MLKFTDPEVAGRVLVAHLGYAADDLDAVERRMNEIRQQDLVLDEEQCKILLASLARLSEKAQALRDRIRDGK